MKFELGYLETLIYEKAPVQQQETLLVKLEKERNRITKAWQKVAVQQAVTMVKKYFQQHQLALMRMAHYNVDEENAVAIQAKNISKEILHLLEFQYRDFMELDYVVPEQVYKAFLATFNSKSEQAM